LDKRKQLPIARFRPEKLSRILFVAALATVCAVTFLPAQGKDNGGQARSDGDASTRLRVEVTAGDSSSPVEAASVYVRYVIKHKLGKDEKIEMNLKTNQQGTVLVPAVPRGEITIQVVAEHWKAFGQKYQATEDEQTIKIHLEKPARWY